MVPIWQGQSSGAQPGGTPGGGTGTAPGVSTQQAVEDFYNTPLGGTNQ